METDAITRKCLGHSPGAECTWPGADAVVGPACEVVVIMIAKMHLSNDHQGSLMKPGSFLTGSGGHTGRSCVKRESLDQGCWLKP